MTDQLNPKDFEYFNLGETENPRFFGRIGETPDFTGKKALDVGCGHGSLCVCAAKLGAAEVWGIDIAGELIEFAKRNLETNYAEVSEVCRFAHTDIRDFDQSEFDIILSKDALEHIEDLEGCLAEIVKRLKPGGKFYFGFGPLYKSHWGDHHRLRARIPWGHLIFPEKWLLKRVRRVPGYENVQTVEDLGLNKLDIADYERMLRDSGLRILSFRCNVSKNPVSRVFTVLSAIRPLRTYLVHNIYGIAEKPISPASSDSPTTP